MRTLSSRFDNRFTTVVVAAAVIGLAGGGVGFAAATIGSAEIEDGSVRSVDIKDNTVKLTDLGKRAKTKLAGQAGPTGPAGPAGPAGDGAVSVDVLGDTEDFDNSNASVSLTPDGVEFGPYANGGATGGSVCTPILGGDTLGSVQSLSYLMRFRSTGLIGDPVGDGDSQGYASPYLRIFTTDGTNDHDAIFSPNTQVPDPTLEEGELIEWVPTQGSWRYDDDGGSNPDITWAQLVADHGTDTIQDICISQGFSAGRDVDGLLRWMEMNGTRYVFEG